MKSQRKMQKSWEVRVIRFTAHQQCSSLGKKDWPTHVYDGSLVMGNLMLAAHDLGIGSCWIHRAKEEFESSWGRELLASLGIEDEYEGIGHCALGYVDGDYPDVIPRKENRVFYLK